MTYVNACRLLVVAGFSNVPSLSNAHEKEFQVDRAAWWQRYANYANFCTQTQLTQRQFHFQVQTDGISGAAAVCGWNIIILTSV